jgi:D-xylose transport system substrate-binding protein
MQFGKLTRLTLAGLTGVVAIVATACGGGGTAGNSPSPVTVPSDLSISSFDANFTYMPKLKDLVNGGHGLVGVILPDTTTSARYVAYDLPYLKKAFDGAGYTSSQYKIDNAQGSATSELALAQADITQGATVLLMDPADSTTGSAIQAYAASHGVKLISYDRATFTGTNTYYVSFDNEKVGELIGQGFLDCVTSWGVTSPKVFTLNGGENSDPNAVSFAMGYNKIVWGDSVPQETVGKTNSKGMTLVGDKVATDWNNATGGAIFQQQFTANPQINSTIEANDGLGNAVVQVLKNKGIKAKKVPTTGQDATLQGMENVLQNYQCGSVYKPIYLEAQDAVALATVLRAGQTPPTALLNGTTTPPSGVSGNQQPASLLVPVWVNAANMNATVIKDQFVDKTALCTAVTTAVCTAAGIS